MIWSRKSYLQTIWKMVYCASGRKEILCYLMCFFGLGYLSLIRRWKGIDQNIVVVNVYILCDNAGKRVLWNDIIQERLCRQEKIWCLAGDFNIVRKKDKRVGVSGVSHSQRGRWKSSTSFVIPWNFLTYQ
ncbi:hypothetical protein AAZX31_03G095500 [Glycine max]